MLSASQKISRVLSGQPFGDGRDGALTISSNTSQNSTRTGCSGSSGSSTLTLAGAVGFVNGDVIFIHQSRGSGAGAWEVNKIVSGGGTSSLTLSHNLSNTYANSGNDQAQAIRIPMYTNVTVDSTFSWSAPDWNEDVSGFLLFAAKGTVDVNGTLNTDSKGFLGGAGGTTQAQQGEGTTGARGSSSAANGNGGGGGPRGTAGAGCNNGGYGGGGGANGANGGSTSVHANCSSPAAPSTGVAAGSADLTTLVFGGGGGGGGGSNTGGAAGGDGSGAIVVFAKNFDIAGGVGTLDGANGSGKSSDHDAGGGGGGAGSCLIMCQTATLGTAKIVATAGTGGNGCASAHNSNGANGGTGRIAIHYSDSYSGSTTPAINATQDTTLQESSGAGLFFSQII